MGTCTACCCLRCIEPRQCFQHSARMVVVAKVAEPGFEIIKTPAKVIEKNRSWAGVTVVVGGSCDLCPIFSCSQSTWSSTLVYTPKAEASWLKDSNLSKICHLACHHVGHSHSLQSSRFPEEPLTRYSCLCVINERGRYTKKYHYPPLSH